jgi:hypothetical protein
MGTRQTQDAIKVIIARTDPRQVLLAEYLRSTGKITSQLMASVDAHLYSYAVAAKPGSSDAEVELAVVESVIALSSQINRILNFHRIDRQIILPNEVLTRCGLIPMSEPVMSPAKSLPLPTIPASPQPLNRPTASATAVREASALAEDGALRFDDDRSEAEDDRDRQTHAGLKLSSSVASFLYGES